MGFGSNTGIDVANEVPGIVRDPAANPWREIDLANGAFGQGIAVTPIQLAQVFAAMVNGGTLVQPRVVRSIGSSETHPIYRGQVIDGALSNTLQRLMVHVIAKVDFYRSRTLIPGFEVGGKTGTAQIWTPTSRSGRSTSSTTRSSGTSAARPGTPPTSLDAVRIEEGTPTVVRLGHLEMPVMSFELFRRIAHDSISTPFLVPEDQRVPAGAGDAP